MKNNLLNRKVLSGIIISMIIFFALLISTRTYVSTVSILVISKSELISLNQKVIVKNIAELPSTMTFYEKLLRENSDLKERNQDTGDNERKEMWNKMVLAEVSPKDSSIIKISIDALSAEDAQNLASKVVRTLLDTASQYYNIKTDIDLRIIDGPINKRSYDNWFWLLLASIALGVSFALLIPQNIFLNFKAIFEKIKEKIEAHKEIDEALVEKKNSKQDETISGVSSEDLSAMPRDTVTNDQDSNKDKDLEALNKIIQQDIYPNFPEMPVSEPRKSSAPDNLPIGDDSFFVSENPEVQKEEEKKEEPEKKEEEVKGEPTPEELKKRLNQLLKGKI